MLEQLAPGGQPLSELRKPFERYADVGRDQHAASPTRGAVIERVAARYADAEQDRLDGLTVDLGDWWFNLRPSNTEPLLRLNLEAADAELPARPTCRRRSLALIPRRRRRPMALDPELLEILACPEDKGPLTTSRTSRSLYNPRLQRRYPIRDDIPMMLIDEAEKPGTDAGVERSSSTTRPALRSARHLAAMLWRPCRTRCRRAGAGHPAAAGGDAGALDRRRASVVFCGMGGLRGGRRYLADWPSGSPGCRSLVDAIGRPDPAGARGAGHAAGAVSSFSGDTAETLSAVGRGLPPRLPGGRGHLGRAALAELGAEHGIARRWYPQGVPARAALVAPGGSRSASVARGGRGCSRH